MRSSTLATPRTTQPSATVTQYSMHTCKHYFTYLLSLRSICEVQAWHWRGSAERTATSRIPSISGIAASLPSAIKQTSFADGSLTSQPHPCHFIHPESRSIAHGHDGRKRVDRPNIYDCRPPHGKRNNGSQLEKFGEGSHDVQSEGDYAEGNLGRSRRPGEANWFASYAQMKAGLNIEGGVCELQGIGGPPSSTISSWNSVILDTIY